MKTRYIYLAVAVVIIGVASFLFANKADRPEDIAASLSPTPALTATSTPGQTPRLSNNNPKPTPGIVITEVMSYEDWVRWLDPQNRRLALDENCSSIVPSQLEYLNDTEIMLDNTASAKPRILKIGGREYSLDARGWILTTLHSDTLPAQLSVYCGSIELGRLDLVAK